MDVRCERCRAQYVFDDQQVTPAGLTVQCNQCGHLFRVKKKELVVTLPVKPEDLSEQPLQASAAARPVPKPATTPVPAPLPVPEWTIRQVGGQTLNFTELNILQRWIVERRVGRDDEVTQGDGVWVKLGALTELQSFFEVVEAASRAPSTTTNRYPAPPAPGAPAPAAPAPAPPPAPPAPAFAPPAHTPLPLPPLPPPYAPPAAPMAPPPAAFPRPSPVRTLRPVAESINVDLDEAELRAPPRGGGRGKHWAAVALLLAAIAVAAWLNLPWLLGQKPAPQPAPKPEPVAAAPAPAPAPVVRAPEPPPPEPKPAPKPEPEPEPVAIPVKSPEPTPPVEKPAPKPPPKPAAPTVRQLLDQARRLREGSRAEQALDLYGRIVAQDPENAEALAGRGLCYIDLEQYGPAEASLDEALRRSPQEGDALMGLAEVYKTRGRKADAILMYERYLAAHPDGDDAAVARNNINQLKE